MEEQGTAYARIREAMAEGYPEPEWIETGPVLRVVLRPHPGPAREGTSRPKGGREEEVVAFLSGRPPASADEIAGQLAVSKRQADLSARTDHRRTRRDHPTRSRPGAAVQGGGEVRMKCEVVTSHLRLRTSDFTSLTVTDPTLTTSPRKLRGELEQLILADFVGPAGGDHEEVDESPVSECYLVGLLAPRRLRVGENASESVEDDLAVAGGADGDEGAPEPAAPPIDQLVPSAIGLTCAVEDSTHARKLTASWGVYRRGRGSG
jgi:hypothetical protein